MKKVLMAIGFAVAVAMGAAAAEYFADAINGNDANDGLTEATAKLSLKEAIALADTGDIVTLLPGDYSNGTVTVSSTLSRAQITKPITLRSKNGRASRDVTRIVGKYDYEGGTGNGKTGGMGDNCVRGLWVTVDGAGSTIEGITFVDCSAPFLTGSGDATSGGGIYFGYGGATSANADKLDIVDCAFIRCQATRGAGTYGGTTVRCLFKSCRHTKYGAGQRAGSSYNSVFDDCHVVPGLGQDSKTTGGVLAYMRYIVNCTIINCEPRVVTTGSVLSLHNCICQNNGDAALPQSCTFNCVTDTSTMTSNSCAVSLIYGTAEVWSPMDGDYRVTAGAKALTHGSAERLAEIPAAYRDTDYYGNPRTTDGTVYCGAVQAVTDEVGSGVAFRLTESGGALTLDGEPFNEGYRTWFQRTGWPFSVKIAFESASPARGLVRYVLSTTSFWPLQDDTIYLVPEENHVKTFATVTGAIVHVDPVAGDDANDGSENAPYRTLQKAVECTAATLVLARAGDYAEGETAWKGSNRVYVSTKKELRVKAVAGADSTFITGAADPAPAIANDHGLGPAAVRCIGVATNAVCCFQGFTLRDGYAGYNADNADTDAVHGGALLNADGITSTYGGVLADCVITNCVCSRGVAFGGFLQRCRMTGCDATKLGLLRSCRAVSSLFDHNPGSGGSIVSQSAQAFNCTFATNGCATLASGYGKAYGCVMGWRGGSDISGTPDEIKYNLYAKRSVSVDATNVQEDPIKFVSPETGDWRLQSISAGAALSWMSYFTSHGYTPVSFDGTPFAILDGGRLPAGAFNVREVATFYVDAANGDDATADGTTEATAYKTLAAALAAAQPGDTVVALPGTYAEGSTVPTKTQSGTTAEPTIAARAVVPDFVTLESRDGPEATVIEGARATVDANSYGCGSDAVRCVFLCPNATVRGFTLYNGHTDSGGSSYADSVDTRGGGVSVANASSLVNGQNCFVENCTITNCAAARGGGGHCGTYRKCRFLNNSAPKPGVAIYFGVVEGCFLDNNSGHSIIYKSKVWNSTILGTQRGSSTSAVNNEGTSETRYPVVNTILGTSSFVSSNLVNCAYSSTARNRWPDAPNVNPAVGDLRMGPDGVPLAGSVAIDAGDASLTPASLGDTDLAGGQRVYNGAMDIGCFEFDWRPKYAAILGKGLAVTAASPEVYAVGESAVAVPSGSLETGWSNATGKKRGYTGTMRVTGNGTLTVTRNGEAFRTVTSADGEQAFQFFSTAALEELLFAYAPGENDDGAALLSGFALGDGFMLILR